VSRSRFFDDPDMDFATRCVLSGVRHAMSEVGEVLAATEAITDGDPDSWLETYVGLGRRCRATADLAVEDGHRYSAWNAALRAANYLYAGAWWSPATRRDVDAAALWAEHRDSWDLAVRLWPSQVWPVRIPHDDGATAPGLWFASPVAGDAPAPTVVLVQGLGTPTSDVVMTGLDGALARGHHVLVIDGPGQGAALHREHRTLQDGWGTLLSSAIDWLGTRPDSDPSRVTLLGVGHGAWFAAAAATTDRRVAALVVDPGVVDLGADAAAAVRDATDDRARALLAATTTTPTGTSDVDDALEVLDRHRLEPEQLARIGCPTLVVRGEAAGSFCGQSAPLLDALECPHTEVVLTSEQGAGLDAGLDASQIHDAVVFDWLDATLRSDPSVPAGDELRGEQGAHA
jgi:dienelactone hydrolase